MLLGMLGGDARSARTHNWHSLILQDERGLAWNRIVATRLMHCCQVGEGPCELCKRSEWRWPLKAAH